MLTTWRAPSTPRSGIYLMWPDIWTDLTWVGLTGVIHDWTRIQNTVIIPSTSRHFFSFNVDFFHRPSSYVLHVVRQLLYIARWWLHRSFGLTASCTLPRRWKVRSFRVSERSLWRPGADIHASRWVSRAQHWRGLFFFLFGFVPFFYSLTVE